MTAVAGDGREVDLVNVAAQQGAVDGDPVALKNFWQGLSLGRKLMQALIKEAQKQSAASISLEVRASNVIAQTLYFSLGFQQVGLRPAYYLDNQEHALLMQLTI